MDFVPDEVLMHIAHHVKDAPSLLNLSRVNKRCRWAVHLAAACLPSFTRQCCCKQTGSLLILVCVLLPLPPPAPRAICCAEALWQDLCMDKFGAPPYSTNDAAFTWKELYRWGTGQ
jgi:hypothetical protein